uniref:Leucine-rich repeat-containing protein DDB_G0290503-like n=1 Tax=Saccoglossus kowalevskii TaxID=10224 RepID=A0ABM0M6I5_SACKO|nr:PREDICTED: putative leucine-rich repeat-containing protein DDB_G0290503-like [Saccoglossus kowalevskii]
MGTSHSTKYEYTDVKSSVSEVDDFQSDVDSGTAPCNFASELESVEYMTTFEGVLQDFVTQFLQMKDENARYRTKCESNILRCFRKKKRSNEYDCRDKIHDLQKMFKAMQEQVFVLVERNGSLHRHVLSSTKDESEVQRNELQKTCLKDQSEAEKNNCELLSSIDLLKQELEKTKDDLDKSKDRERQVSDDITELKENIKELTEIATDTLQKHNSNEEEYEWKISQLEDQLSNYKTCEKEITALRNENRKFKEVYGKYKSRRKNTIQHYSGLIGELRKSAPNNLMLEETHSMLTESLKKYDRKSFK